MASQFIFPTSVYGQFSDVYGKAVPQYANTPQGVPQNSGLLLGQFGVLFDGTICRLLNALGTVNPYDAVYASPGGSTDYNVLQASAVQQYVTGFNDRSGSVSLVANNIAWFTTKGLAMANCGASLTAGQPAVSSTTPGFLAAYSPGSTNLQTGVITGNSIQTNIQLLTSSTSQGVYPVRVG